MRTEFYATTTDEKNRTHHFKVSANDPAPEGHDVIDLRPAGKFRVSALLSPESLATLKSVRPATRKGR